MVGDICIRKSTQSWTGSRELTSSFPYDGILLYTSEYTCMHVNQISMYQNTLITSAQMLSPVLGECIYVFIHTPDVLTST
jgi:hypothetical protein